MMSSAGTEKSVILAGTQQDLGSTVEGEMKMKMGTWSDQPCNAATAAAAYIQSASLALGAAPSAHRKAHLANKRGAGS